MKLGALLDYPDNVCLFDNDFGAETYTKALLTAHGTLTDINCPASLMFETDRWRVWQMRSANDHKHWYIAYDPKATTPNAWWDKLLVTVGKRVSRVPRLFGDVVLFRHGAAITTDEKLIRRELINWLVCRYLYETGYNFCVEQK